MVIFRRKIAVMKTHSSTLEEYKSKAELQNIKYYQELYLRGIARGKAPKNVKEETRKLV